MSIRWVWNGIFSARDGPAKHGAAYGGWSPCLEDREQCCGSMMLIVIGYRQQLCRFDSWARLTATENVDSALLVDAQDYRVNH
jgi:hypothetical protein